MVIVVTGILGAVVAIFIAKPVQGYVDSVRRAELTDAADQIARRFAREVHLALPNSLRVQDSSGHVGSCTAQTGVTCFVEFILTSGGGRYRDASDGSTGGNVLSFTNAGAVAFDVLGPMPASPAIAAGDYIVVYNLGPGYAPADAYATGDPCSNCNRATVAQTPAGNLVTLSANPFASQTPPLSSPSGSFQVVPGNVKAVSYACPTAAAGNLVRYWNYGFNPNLSTSPAGSSALMAANVSCTVAPYSSTNAGAGALLGITFTLTDPDSGERVTLAREIHVDNSP